MLQGVLLALARRGWLGSLVSLAFEQFSWLLPVDRVLDGDLIIAFHHPRPSQANHLLIVPKKRILNLVRLARPSNEEYFPAVLRGAVVSAAEFSSESWTLLVNGGSSQEVAHVHFHFLPEFQKVTERQASPLIKVRTANDAIVYAHNSCPEWGTHLVVALQPQPSLQDLLSSEKSLADDLLHAIASTIEDLSLDEHPYTVAIQVMESDREEALSVHIVSSHEALPRWRRSGSN